MPFCLSLAKHLAINLGRAVQLGLLGYEPATLDVDEAGNLFVEEIYCSIGVGFVVSAGQQQALELASLNAEDYPSRSPRRQTC